jgi:hypothetical protein
VKFHNLFLGLIYVTVTFAVTACGSKVSESATLSPESCTITKDGQTLFLGTKGCLSNLPTSNISGYWVVDFEYSVFYPDKMSIKPGYDNEATWLEFSDEANSVVTTHLQDSRQIFEIRFIGARPLMPGAYGRGTFRRGAFVSRVIELKEVGFK